MYWFILSDALDAPRGSDHLTHPGQPRSFDAQFMMEASPGGRIRSKRSTHNNHNNEYTMEILVAVDKKMQEYHGDETRNYVLTLMSIVSQRPRLQLNGPHLLDGGH